MAVASFEGVRLIPAHAGKTLVTSVVYRAAMAHPRVSRENRASCSSVGAVAGSSPRERGKPGYCYAGPKPLRLIPA